MPGGVLTVDLVGAVVVEGEGWEGSEVRQPGNSPPLGGGGHASHVAGEAEDSGAGSIYEGPEQFQLRLGLTLGRPSA